MKHNHKEDLGCVPGPHLKRCHKTLELVQIIYHPTCTLLETIEQWNIYIYQDTQTLSSIDAVHSDKHIYRI